MATRPGEHVPATPHQVQLMDADETLSQAMERAMRAGDMELLIDVLAEKNSINTALDKSRAESWDAWGAPYLRGAA